MNISVWFHVLIIGHVREIGFSLIPYIIMPFFIFPKDPRMTTKKPTLSLKNINAINVLLDPNNGVGV